MTQKEPITNTIKQDKTTNPKEELVEVKKLNNANERQMVDKPSPKSKNKLIVGIIIGAVFVIALLVIIIINPFKLATTQKASKDSNEKEKIETQQQQVEDKSVPDNSEIVKKEIEISNEFIIGTWKGKMGGKNLTIVIEDITNNSVTGYNILGNNKRNLNGTWGKVNYDIPCCCQYHLTLNEPGDDKWDGVFEIDFVACNETNENENGIECLEKMQSPEGNGNWKSNNGKLEHSFEIKKAL